MAEARNRIQDESLKVIHAYIEFKIDGRTVDIFLRDYKSVLADRERLEDENEKLRESYKQLKGTW